MITRWEKRGDYWTNISSPDFVRRPELRGYLEIPGHGLLPLGGVKKNDMRWLWYRAPKFLRQEGAAYPGFTVREDANLFGDGDPACSVPEIREGEAGGDRVVIGQSFIHEAICLLRRAEMSSDDHTGCGHGGEIRLAYGKGAGQAVHGGATASYWSSGSTSNRDRRGLDKEGTYLSDCGQ